MVNSVNCPHYDYCHNNLFCPSCSVCGGDTYLGPAPSEVTTAHTKRVTARRKKVGRRSQREGYEAERAIFQRLGGVHNPSSQGYDGTIGCLRVEYKLRLAGGAVLPTKAEWKKAVEQGNKLVIVEDKVTGEATVTMSLETFESIREYL